MIQKPDHGTALCSGRQSASGSIKGEDQGNADITNSPANIPPANIPKEA
jgi:hypothetical protein